MTGFVHLHLHSSYSLSEGAIRLGALRDLCLAENMPAVAVTDTNNLFGALEASETLAAPLRPIVRSAAELLVSDQLDRVRECDGARCTWLFLDQSRNRSRRWCSMETCGNRAKARRHYRRTKADDEE